MRLLSVRLILSLIVGVLLVSLCSSGYEVWAGKLSLRRDLQRRSEVLAESLAGGVERDIERGSLQALRRTTQHFANRENLMGMAVYDPEGHIIAITKDLAPKMAEAPPVVRQTIKDNSGADAFQRLDDHPVHICVLPLYSPPDKFLGALAIVHDAGYIRDQSIRIWRDTFLSGMVQVILIALITLLIVRWSIEGPIARTAHWLRALRTGHMPSSRVGMPDEKLYQPLAREVATLAQSLNSARTAAEREARLRAEGQSQWTAERLTADLRNRLGGSRLFVVSNREPYIHKARGKSVEVQVPASGLVTALEPVLNACEGTWVAHGSGTADRDMVDKHDRLAVPPESPAYAQYLYWVHFAEGSLMTLMLIALVLSRVAEAKESPVKERIGKRLHQMLAFVDGELAGRDYFAGAEFTAADVMMVFPFTTMRRYLDYDIAPYANITRYMKRIEDRPAYAKAMRIAGPDVKR